MGTDDCNGRRPSDRAATTSHDTDVDKILAVLVAALAIGSCQLVLHRLGAIGEFWNVHLLGVISWVLAISILKFGSRAAARTRVAWLFLLSCFPPLFLLAGQALGGILAWPMVR